METWPATINEKVLQDGFSQTQRPNTIRTTIDAGIDKLRRRYTTPIRNVRVAMYLTFAQYSTLETFYNTTLQGGVLSFEFPDPATDVDHEYRFLSPPTYVAAGGLHYQVSMEWERLD